MSDEAPAVGMAAQPAPENLTPGELARLTAGCLAAAGITVTSDGADSELELHPGPDPWPREQAAEADAERWTLAVDDYARARLDYAPAQAQAADPHRIAAIAAALLTGAPPSDGPPDDAPSGDVGRPDDDSTGGPGDGIMRTAGLDLRRRGLAVALSAHTDDEALELSCDLLVTAPGDDSGDPATVYIADNGTLQFDRSYWADHAAEERTPAYRTWLPDPAACAAAIADTVTAAIAAALPPEADRTIAERNERGLQR
jgi:hypothetical protein